MKEKHLKYFVELVKFKNYSRAAESLYVSQSTISKAIKKIENNLSYRLIDLDDGSFKLTEAGKIFYNYANEVLEYLEIRKNILYKDLRNLKST